MTTDYRNIRLAVADLSKRNDLDSFYLQDGINPREGIYILLSIGLVVLATVGSGALGWLLTVELWKKPEYSLAVVLASGGLVGFVAGLFIFDWLINASSTSYEAHMKENDVRQHEDEFVQVTPRQLILLSANDKRLLQTFAQHWPRIKTLAINEWEGANSPFSFADDKREAIRRVRDLVIKIGTGHKVRGGGMRLNEHGRQQISLWAVGNFDTLTPPPPNGGDQSSYE